MKSLGGTHKRCGSSSVMETALGKLPPRFYLCSWSQKSVTCRNVSVFLQRYFRFNKAFSTESTPSSCAFESQNKTELIFKPSPCWMCGNHISPPHQSIDGGPDTEPRGVSCACLCARPNFCLLGGPIF
ncbi:hypothetical protein ILYODFUR_010035 [Ilyodon furcidens]|uniref:Uncharacterized protein n=1 Tax=Ilyodon furcidens TaxID=33524 RepID=A0ABV0T6S6_9TELE